MCKEEKMENLLIQETKYTPRVELNADDGTIKISGKSYPENTFDYYLPITNWIENYFKESQNVKTIVDLDLEYLNSSSLKAYFDMFDILEDASQNKKEIKINWIYDEDNDISQETGEDFIEDFEDLDISLVVKS